MARLFVDKRRSDGKWAVQYIFETGKRLNKIQTTEQIAEFLKKAPDTEVFPTFWKRQQGLEGMKKRRRALGGLGLERIVCSDEKTSLTRVRLNQGGYDENGRYFGRGEPLWSYDNRDSWGHVRATSRAAAKAKIRAKCPRTRFYR